LLQAVPNDDAPARPDGPSGFSRLRGARRGEARSLLPSPYASLYRARGRAEVEGCRLEPAEVCSGFYSTPTQGERGLAVVNRGSAQ